MKPNSTQLPPGAVKCPSCDGFGRIRVKYYTPIFKYTRYFYPPCTTCSEKGYMDWLENITKQPAGDLSTTDRYFRCSRSTCRRIYVFPPGLRQLPQIALGDQLRCHFCRKAGVVEFKPQKKTLKILTIEPPED